METLENPGQVTQAINTFVMKDFSKQPKTIRDALEPVIGSADVQMRIINTGEFLYARRADITDPAKILAAQIALFGDIHGLHHYRDGRGAAMSLALRREVGDQLPPGVDYPDAENDPEPRPEWVPASEGDGPPSPPAP